MKTNSHRVSLMAATFYMSTSLTRAYFIILPAFTISGWAA
jgi:hypothetical protein